MRRRFDWALAGVLAVISYVPLLATKPGMVAADTKQYLYLDPAKLTTSAASMWDPNVGLGTVTHQNIGYLFPMGPYFTLVKWLHVPVWVGQRIWMGSLLFLAGLGVAYCARRLGLAGLATAVAALAYTLSPYLIDYLGRTSAILMPWAALGWMVGLTAMAARTGRWRHPALFALVVALVGGVNATSILLVLVAPGLWLLYAAAVTHEVSARRAVATGLRLCSLSALVSLWWAAGLWAEGRYGINILRVTETVPTVSRTSSASEVLRGLGYWYFYGWDKVQPWTLQSVGYSQSPWLSAVSYLVPAAAIVVGFFARWRYRAYAVGLVGIGTLVAVGAYPYSHPSLFGSAIKNASAGSTVALAMRSVDRIVPVVVLGLALMMGAGIASIRLRYPTVGVVAALACVALVAADMPPLWTGDMIASNLDRPSSLPAYWNQAASYLDSAGSDRVLGLPGEDFAAYSWGVTQDPVAPGLLDRPYVSRQVVPAGTPASANLVQALDEPLQEGTLDMSALAPVARLMSAGQILLQSDLQYERYHLPLPQVLWQEMTSQASGLGRPTTFGPPNPAKQIKYPLNSEIRLGIPTGSPQPPALAVFNVPGARPLVRAEPASAPTVLAGDGNGIVEAAAAGLLGGDPTILYSASYANDPSALARAITPGSALVVTDTNSLASQRWGSLRDNTGQVDQPGLPPLSTSPSDYSLPVFPGAGTSTQTVAEVAGVKSVEANAYGDSLSFTPENRPVNALDGDPSTAWTYGAHSPVAGGRIEVQLLQPVTTDQVTLLQAQLARPDRRIGEATITFDGGSPVKVRLTPASYKEPGQVVTFRARTFSRLDVTVDSASPPDKGKRYDGLSQVGLAEIGIPGVGPAQETLRMPEDLLSSAGASSAADALDILMSRQRAVEPPRHDPEPQMARQFSLPTPRTFTVAGTAEISAGDSDYLIDQLVGLNRPFPTTSSAAVAGSTASVVDANSSTRLDGDRNARANAALDGDPNTAWVAETGPQAGEWFGFDVDRPVSFGHLDLQVVNDGRHSLPTRLTISTPDTSRTVDVPAPPVGYGRPQGSTTTVPIDFPAITGSRFKITIDSVRQVRSLDYYATFTGATDILPVGIAELGLRGIDQPSPPAQLPAVCQTGLLTVDGAPVDVEVTGSTAAALAGQPLQLRPCGNSLTGLHLAPGPHVVRTSPRLPSGWSIDSLDLESAPEATNAASANAAYATGAGDTAATATAAPSVKVTSHNSTSWTVTVSAAPARPFWLVLGQSYSSGWRATTASGRSLGAPHLVDGYATGWYVPAGELVGTTKVHIVWAPQRVVWAAIGASGAGLVLCVLLAFLPSRRRAAPGSRPARGRADRGSGPSSLLAAVRRRPLMATAAVAIIWGLVSAAASRPAIGAAGLAAVVVGAALPHGRTALRVVCGGSLLLLPAYIVQQQAAHRYLPTIDWPASFGSANDIAWFALVILGSDLVAGALRASARPGSGAAPANRLAGGRDREV